MKRRWWIVFAAIDFVGWRLMAIARWLGIRGGRQPEAGRPVRRMLLVQLDHLGDAVLSTGMIGELARRYPQARIEVLAAPWNAEIFAALPRISHVHICRCNRFARRGRLGWPLAIFYWGWRLRSRRFDLGVDIRGDFPFTLLLWLAGIGRRVGWAAGGGGFLLTDSAEYRPDRPQAAARACLLDAIAGLPEGTGPVPLPRFEPPVSARDWAARQFEGWTGKSLMVAHISAGTQAKRWPVGYWQELFGRLIVEFEDVQIVMVGSQADRELARMILDDRAWPRISNWTGTLSICRLAAVIERAGCFVGADSGPAHLAAAVGTPAVVLFSGTNDAGVWCPAGDVAVLQQPVACAPCYHTACPLADHPCMRGIEPRRVAAAIAKKLASGRQRAVEQRSHCALPGLAA
ncbi:MAG TPA: glycosyltransferase family 9 protein [Pirellulales bacterium]|nr:glycosyltransferase family 9 protein [Pirellulales bacterium]